MGRDSALQDSLQAVGNTSSRTETVPAALLSHARASRCSQSTASHIQLTHHDGSRDLC